jgi:hypothetical protein
MKNKLSYDVYIKSGVFTYSEQDWKDKLDEFKLNHEGKKARVSLEIIDGPGWHSHKWYRGYLMPDIALSMGEGNVHYVHMMLKRDFLYTDCCGVEEIPKKYCKKGLYPVSDYNLLNLNSTDYPYSMIKGIIISYNEEGGVEGYIPSTSDLSYEDMKEYILKCENRLFIDLSGHIQEKHSKVGVYHRRKAFEESKNK